MSTRTSVCLSLSNPGGTAGNENLIVSPFNLNSSDWTRTNMTVNPTAVTNPVNGETDGNNINNTNTTQPYIKTAITYNVLANDRYTLSCYAKYTDNPLFWIGLTDGTSVPSRYAGSVYNIQTGVVTLPNTVAGGGTNHNRGIIDAGSGWYRVWNTVSFNADRTVVFETRVTFNTTWFGASSTNRDANVWGFKMEQGEELTSVI